MQKELSFFCEYHPTNTALEGEDSVSISDEFTPAMTPQGFNKCRSDSFADYLGNRVAKTYFSKAN